MTEEVLESKGYKIGSIKTEYMHCNFNEHIERAKTTMRIEDHDIIQSNSFCYHDSIICMDEEIDEDVEHKMKAGWLKWRLAYGVFCD